jgi:hypothetical protein
MIPTAKALFTGRILNLTFGQIEPFPPCKTPQIGVTLAHTYLPQAQNFIGPNHTFPATTVSLFWRECTAKLLPPNNNALRNLLSLHHILYNTHQLTNQYCKLPAILFPPCQKQPPPTLPATARCRRASQHSPSPSTHLTIGPHRRRSIPIATAATRRQFDTIVDDRPPADAELDALPHCHPYHAQ